MMRAVTRAVKSASQPIMVRGMASSTLQFKLANPFKGHKLTPPDDNVETTRDELIQYFREMVLYRRVEMVADTMYKMRKVRGFCHLYDGQEAIVVGMEAAIKRTDSVITAYRDHCHQISRGDTVESMFAELMGRIDGCSRGKGGSMHMYYKKGNFYGGNGIVGAQVALGGGIAMAHKMRKDGGLCVAIYGDGAANQGQVFEVANMAALWKLPVIFLCENNTFAMGTAVHRHAASTDFYTRGDYVPGLWIDGMDVLAVKKGFDYAANWCREGNGPIFVEALTYRYHGHSMSDAGTSYRTRDEVQVVRDQRDPIDSLRKRILQSGAATNDELKAIEREIRKQVDEAAAKAEASPEPPLSELYDHIYAGAPPPVVRGTTLENSVRFSA